MDPTHWSTQDDPRHRDPSWLPPLPDHDDGHQGSLTTGLLWGFLLTAGFFAFVGLCLYLGLRLGSHLP